MKPGEVGRSAARAKKPKKDKQKEKEDRASKRKDVEKRQAREAAAASVAIACPGHEALEETRNGGRRGEPAARVQER